MRQHAFDTAHHRLYQNSAGARISGARLDGFVVYTTVAVIDGENTFEMLGCNSCGTPLIRAHDAEAYRVERKALADRIAARDRRTESR
jgi:hypothetical protein